MEAWEYDREPRLPFVCAECGDELVLTSSGHQFCANRCCRDGFEVRPDWRLVSAVELLVEQKKLK
jgi:hypothetical protein